MILEGQTLAPSKMHVKGILVHNRYLNNIPYYIKVLRHVNFANFAILKTNCEIYVTQKLNVKKIK